MVSPVFSILWHGWNKSTEEPALRVVMDVMGGECQFVNCSKDEAMLQFTPTVRQTSPPF